MVKDILQDMKSPSPKCDDCAECGCNRVDGTCGCGGKMKSWTMERVFGRVGKPQFKGKGFYETDYKNPKISMNVGGKNVPTFDSKDQAIEVAERANEKEAKKRNDNI